MNSAFWLSRPSCWSSSWRSPASASSPQGFNFIVERLGRYQEALHPGFNVIFPVINSVRAKVDMRETVVDVPSQSVITMDNAAVTADGVLYFQVLDPMKATYEVNDLQRAIQTLAMTTTRTVGIDGCGRVAEPARGDQRQPAARC